MPESKGAYRSPPDDVLPAVTGEPPEPGPAVPGEPPEPGTATSVPPATVAPVSSRPARVRSGTSPPVASPPPPPPVTGPPPAPRQASVRRPDVSRTVAAPITWSGARVRDPRVLLAAVCCGLLVVVVALAATGLFGGASGSLTPVASSSGTGTRGSGSDAASAQPARPQTAPEAARLSAAAAKAELRAQVEDDAQQVAWLAGRWVPQVSSKCVGAAADLGPGWMPDGTVETRSVSRAQIAAFSLSMKQSFGALTALPTAVGIARDQATAGVCRGRTTWMSLAPEKFRTADGANGWCDRQRLPTDECLARYVARPGETSRKVMRPQ